MFSSSIKTSSLKGVKMTLNDTINNKKEEMANDKLKTDNDRCIHGINPKSCCGYCRDKENLIKGGNK
jgi:hypothetical protein